MSESVVISKTTDVVNVSISGQGEVNTGQNVGTGAGIFKEKIGADFRYRSVIGGTGITATQNTNDVTLDLPQEVATNSAVQFASVNIDGQTTLSWDNQNKTLKFPTNSITVEVGQDMHTLVRNTTGTTIAKGKVVYITGSTGNKKTIALASNLTEVASSTVFGVTEEAIANNANGFVSTQGLIAGLNTQGLSEGAAIWLSTAGNFTTTKPVTPAHLVLIGYIVSANPSNGSIYVKIQNGYEIEELHNVLITSPTNNQALVYDTANSYWKNAKLDISDFTDTGGLLAQDDLSNNDTDDLAEGSTNLYYTTARANTDFDTRLATKTTDNLTEGSTNVYYTDARVGTYLAAIDQSIVPDTDVAYDLGSPTKQWRDVYIGPGSLYVNNKKVIEDDAGTITVETDADQNLRVRTSGTGNTQITSAQAVQITGTESADIELTTATGQIELNGDVVIDVTKSLSTSTGGTLTVNAPLNLGSNALTANDVTVNGNLTVSGTTTTVNTEELLVADNTVVLNSNYTGSSPSENAGIEIERGTQTNKTLLWDETSDRWTVGTETFVAGTVIANLTGDVTGTVSSLSNHDTDDLAEGAVNLYYTTARANTDFDAQLATKTTNDLTEGTNLYYTDTRANTAIDARVTKAFVENLDIDIDGGTY